MTSTGNPLRARREGLGRTLEDVANTTRIPIEHLRALEEGRIDDLPKGPYAAAYLRTLHEELGIAPPATPPAPPAEGGGIPLWAVRWLAGLSAAALLATIGWQVWAANHPERLVPVPGDDIEEADQHVEITTRQTTRLKVLVDDEVVLERKVPGGETLAFSGLSRVEVQLPAVGDARIRYNGQPIVPQGRQDAPRTLVFVDDLQGGE